MRKQNGFSLVELMIGMTLSLILLAGVGSVFLSSQRGYRLQNGIAVLHENGRAVLDLLTQDLLMAGYPQSDAIDALVPAGTAEGGGNSDRFAVQYESDLDCRGEQTPLYANGKRYARNQYSVQNGTLVCTALDEAGDPLGTAELMPNVTNLQVLYGVDGDADDNATRATRYVRADNVASWGDVVAVRFALLIASGDTIAADNDTQTYTLLNQVAVAAANDKQRRRLFSSTVLLRNRS